jgi:hypothetical protein
VVLAFDNLASFIVAIKAIFPIFSYFSPSGE